MIAPRRSISDCQDSRKTLRFGEARLVSMDNSSYLELEQPELEPDNASLSCSFCTKTTTHEHEFNGRIKFIGKENKLLVSFIKTNLPPKRPRKALQIVALPKNPKSPNEEARAKMVPVPTSTPKIYPLIARDESEAVQLMKQLVQNMEEGGVGANGPKVAAVRIGESETIHLLKQLVQSGKSLLKPSKCSDCVLESARRDLLSLCEHIKEKHASKVMLKRITCPSTTANENATEDEADSAGEDEMFHFPCGTCDEAFAQDDERIKHRNQEHASKSEIDFQCLTCLQTFKTKSVFHQHLSTHTKKGPRSHACNICAKSFYKIQHLQEHFQTHSGAKPFPCKQCDKRYTSSYSLKFHEINVHGTGQKPVCQYCDKSFYNTSQVNKHIMRVHLKDSRLHCQICQKFFLRRDNLDEHIRNVHGQNSESLKCKVCGLYRANQKSLEDHMQNDHGVLPWNRLSQGPQKKPLDIEQELKGHLKCKICEHNFLPAEMEIHLRFNHGVMPVKPGALTDFSVSEAAEALLRNLTPQPDYLLRCLTPLPMEILDDFIAQ